MSVSRRFLLALLPVAAAAPGCTSRPLIGPNDPISVPGFVDLQPALIASDAVRVEISPATLGPDQIRDPFPLETAVRTWAERRFRPGGGLGEAVVRIDTASVTKERVARSGSVIPAWLQEQIDEVHRSQISVTILRSDGAAVQAQAGRTLTLPEDALIVDKRIRLAQFLEQTVRDLDAQIMPTLADSPLLIR